MSLLLAGEWLLPGYIVDLYVLLLATSFPCFLLPFLCMPTFDYHMLLPFFFLCCCKSFTLPSTTLVAQLTVSLSVLACSCLQHLLYRDAVHVIEIVSDELHQDCSYQFFDGSSMAAACQFGCDSSRRTQVLTDPASQPFKVSAVVSKTPILGTFDHGHTWRQLRCYCSFSFPRNAVALADVCGDPHRVEERLTVSRWQRKGS